MLFRKVFSCRSQCVVWITLLITLTSLLLNSSGVVADSEKDKETVTSKVVFGDKSEKMIGLGTNIDRRSSRVKLFDDIFNVYLELLCVN